MLALCVRNAVRGIRRAPGPAALCAVAVAAALLLPELLGVLWTNYERMREAALGDARVIAFARADTPEADVRALAAALGARDEVAEARAVAPEEVARWMAAQYPELAGAAAGDEDALFPAVVEVALRRDAPAAARDALAGWLAAQPSVEALDAGTHTLARLEAVATTARRAGTGAGVLLGVVALLGIGTAVRLSIHARRDEIEVQRLVGATRTFVRVPFLIEGLALGAAGAALSLAVTWGAWAALGPAGGTVAFPFGALRVAFLPLSAAAAAVPAGALLGLAGSALGLARHLRES
ncbi:MAG TPA: FtsX-like permease family protein [Myxococcota bacterium]|jgi:cell division transport system permease protein|nr:FtsX-like permease family protein [Myxococcota bacterium]